MVVTKVSSRILQSAENINWVIPKPFLIVNASYDAAEELSGVYVGRCL